MKTQNSVIAVLGGSGKAGRPLVQKILTLGYHARLLLRNPQLFGFSHERLELIQGDARDPLSIRQLLHGCSALISTLGHTKGEITPMMSAATGVYVNAMHELGLRRCVIVTSLFETGTEQLDDKTQEAANYMQENYPVFMEDRRQEFKLLTQSSLDWTYVRVPLIVQEPISGSIEVNLNYLPGQSIAATDLAHFLVDQINDRQYVRQAPFVASKAG